MKLVTKRLILRIPIKKDIPDLIEGLNDLQVSKNISTVPYPYTKKDAEWWINHCTSSLKEKRSTKYNFNIELKSEKNLVGGIGIMDINDFDGTCKIGYWVSRKYWGKGIVSEAIKKMLDFTFNKLKLRRVVLKAYIENVASNHLAKKFGFKLEGMERKSVKAKSTGKIHDVNTYSLLKSDYKK